MCGGEGKCWYTMIDCFSFCFPSVAEGVGGQRPAGSFGEYSFTITIQC